MTIEELLEVTLKIEVNLPNGLSEKDFQKEFDKTLKEIFTTRYFNKVKRNIRNLTIRHKGKKLKFFQTIFTKVFDFSYGEENSLGSAIARVESKKPKTILINRKVNKTIILEDFKAAILHEFMHTLQFSENNKVFKEPEFFNHSQDIANVIWDNLKKDKKIEEFFGARAGRWLGIMQFEAVAYLIISGSSYSKVNWNVLRPKGKKAVIKVLKKGDIFNINSDYWKRVLR